MHTVFGIFFIFFIYYLLSGLSLPLHADEYEWVGRSYFFDLFIQGDSQNKLNTTYYAFDQPKLAYYVFGVALYPKYLFEKNQNDITSYISFLHLHKLYQDNTQNTPSWNKVSYEFAKQNFLGDWPFTTPCVTTLCPSFELIKMSRIVNVLFSSLTIIVVLYIGWNIYSNIKDSLLLTFLFGINPLIRNWSLQATADSIFLLLFCIGLYLILKLKTNSKLKITIVFGIVVGLCFSTKIHGILLLILAMVAISINLLKSWINKKSVNWAIVCRSLVMMLFIFSSFLIVSYTLNPFLWHEPQKKYLELFNYRSKVSREQQITYPYSSLPSVISRINAVNKHLFGEMLWINNHNKQEANLFVCMFTAGVFVLGLGRLVKLRLQNNNTLVLLFTFFTIYIFMIVFLQLDWPRYYNILLLPFYSILIFGFQTIIKHFPSAYFALKKRFAT